MNLIKVLVVTLLLSVSVQAEYQKCNGIWVKTNSDLSLANDLGVEHSIYEVNQILQQHPMNVMNAYQRFWTLVNYKDSYKIQDPYHELGQLTFYPVLSEGIPETQGRMVVGHAQALSNIMGIIKRGALGDYGAKNMAIAVIGPAGTGKSEFMKVINKLAINLSNSSPDYAYYTFEFKNLHEIDGLKYRFGNYGKYDRFESPLKDSPMVLLFKDPALQAQLINDATPNAMKLSKGIAPTPFLNPDPQTEKIINEMILHYKRQDPKRYGTIDTKKYLEILDKHVVIKKRNMNNADKWPKIGAQGDEIDWEQLYMATNAQIMFEKGQADPFSYHLNGEVIKSHGGVMVYEEYFRNKESFRDTTLDVVEGGEVQRGSAPMVDIDNVIFIATNDESITKADAEGAIKAQIDRIHKETMRLTDKPDELGRILVLLQGDSNFEMRKLGKTAGKWEKGDINKMYPAPKKNAPYYKNYEGKYALRLKNSDNEQETYFAPHVMELITSTLAASRMVTDAKAVEKLKYATKVRNESVFKDHITRLQYYAKEYRENNPAFRKQLQELHTLLKEGDTGISNRSGKDFMTALVHKSEYYNYTISYEMVIQEFQRMAIVEDQFNQSDAAIREEWRDLLQKVADMIVIPKILDDIYYSLGSINKDADFLYTEIKDELVALSRDQKAEEYFSSIMNQNAKIDKDRLKSIAQSYELVNRTKLQAAEIHTFVKSQEKMKAAQKNEKFMPLYDAIKDHIGRQFVSDPMFTRITAYAHDGKIPRSDIGFFNKFKKVMFNERGYNEQSLKEAMRFLKEQKLKFND